MSENDRSEMNENKEKKPLGVTQQTVTEIEFDPDAPLVEEETEVEAKTEEKEDSSGGIFSTLLKNRRARMEAVGEDDDYDIFDLQEMMDISDEDFLLDEPESPAEDASADEASSDADGEEEPHESRKHSLFSRLKKNRAEEEEKPEAEEEVEIEEIRIDEPQIEEPVEDEAEEEEEEEEDDYVSPLVELESFENETRSAIDDLNKLLASAGIDTIEGASKEESPKTVEEEIAEKFDIEIEDRAGMTKKVTLPEEKKADEPETEKEESDEIEEEESEQMTIDGFDDDDIEPDLVDEEYEQEKLSRKRRKLIESFHLFSREDAETEPDDIPVEGTADIVEDVELQDGEGVFEAVERTASEKRSFIGAVMSRLEKKAEEERLYTLTEIKKQILKDRKKIGTKFIIELVIAAALVVFAVIGASYAPEESTASIFAGSGRIFVLINLIIYATSVAVSFDMFKAAVDRVRSGIIDSRAVFLCLNIIVLLQMLVALASGLNGNSGFVVYALVGTASIIAELFSKKVNCESLSKSLVVLTKSELAGIQPVENKSESGALGYDLAPDGEPSIYFSTAVKVPENIAYLSENTSKEQGLAKFSILFPFFFGIVLAVVLCIIHRSAMPLVTVVPCCFALCLPVLRPLILSFFKSEANKGSIVNGVSVLSYDDCDEVSRANAVVLDISDLFGANVSEFKKAGTSKMAKSDAVVYTASVLKKSESILSDCFDGFIDSLGIELPDAEDFKYEEGLGFSAWVNGLMVLVGNRRCVENHSIPCPTEEEEKAYCPDGNVLYTCVGDRIVSTFVARYLPRRNAKKQMSALAGTGIVVMLRSFEPSFGDDDVASVLHCPPAMVKIISSAGNDIISKCRENADKYDRNSIFSARKKRNILLAVSEAFYLSSRRVVSKRLSTVVAVLLPLIYALFAVFKATVAFSPITVLLVIAAAAAATYFISKATHRH